MPPWRKILGLCFSVPLVIVGVALVYNEIAAEHFLHADRNAPRAMASRPVGAAPLAGVRPGGWLLGLR
jgi:hypothetical protein